MKKTINYIVCIVCITCAVYAGTNKEKQQKDKGQTSVPRMVGVQLEIGTNSVTDPTTGTVYTVVYKDGSIQSVTIIDPKNKTGTPIKLQVSSRKMNDCPDVNYCYENPFEKRVVCVCLPPAKAYRAGTSLKTIWKFTNRE